MSYDPAAWQAPGPRGLALLLGSGAGFLLLAAGMGRSLTSSIKIAWDLMTHLRPVAVGAD